MGGSKGFETSGLFITDFFCLQFFIKHINMIIFIMTRSNIPVDKIINKRELKEIELELVFELELVLEFELEFELELELELEFELES